MDLCLLHNNDDCELCYTILQNANAKGPALEFLGSQPDDTNEYLCTRCGIPFELKVETLTTMEPVAKFCPFCGAGK